MAVHSLLFLASCCLMLTGHLIRGIKVPSIPLSVCSLRCNNAMNCLNLGDGKPNCDCLPGLSGDRYEVYIGDNTSTSANNIALNMMVVHCKSGAQGIDLANNSIWSTDVCYNLTTDNVMIVDLGGIYNVKNVTINSLKQIYASQNVRVSVGWHLGHGCSVTDEAHCADYVGSMDSGIHGAPCEATTTGRYIRIQYNKQREAIIQNNKQGEAIICIHQASGVPVDQSMQQAWFSNTLYTFSSGVSPFKGFPRRQQAQLCKMVSSESNMPELPVDCRDMLTLWRITWRE